MPVREAKGRFLTREYMADARFHIDLTAAQREFYIMLSLFADDGGWLEWVRDDLMYAIYRFDNDREATFEDGVAALERTGRLKVLRCGHASMPKVAQHPRGGVQEYRIRDHHESTCNRVKSGGNRVKTILPPNHTKPNLTSPDHTNEGIPSRPPRARGGARARGGLTAIEPSDFKSKVGWEPGATG